jgi:hypothetical protein
MSTLLAVSGAVALVFVVWMASRGSRSRKAGDDGASSWSDGGSAGSDCPDGAGSGGCDGGADGGGD